MPVAAVHQQQQQHQTNDDNGIGMEVDAEPSTELSIVHIGASANLAKAKLTRSARSAREGGKASFLQGHRWSIET